MKTFTTFLFNRSLYGTKKHYNDENRLIFSFGRRKAKMNHAWRAHVYKMRNHGKFGALWDTFNMDRRYGGYNDKKHIHRHSWALAGHDMYRHVWMADEIRYLDYDDWYDDWW